MKPARPPKQTNWDKTGFRAFQESLPAARLAEDARRLKDLFNMAAQAPEAQAALDWARAHDIDFMIDHTTTAGGYYWHNTGVVAIAGKVLEEGAGAAGGIRVLVHEIRHAWQDHYGMIATRGTSFADAFIKTALIEADAEAHGNFAKEQFNLAMALERADSMGNGAGTQKAVIRKKQWVLEGNRDNILWRQFRTWGNSSLAASYGKTAARRIGSRLGIPGVTPTDHAIEFTAYAECDVPLARGIDYTRAEQLRRLGKGFKGRNYFNAAKREEIAKMLSPGLANRFFDAARRPDPLVTEVMRRQMRLKRHKKQEILL